MTVNERIREKLKSFVAQYLHIKKKKLIFATVKI